jgi:hypothetical protein
MRSARRWIWRAVTLQVLGLAFDAVWHGLIDPDFEATTVAEMAAHLGTVHVPIYLGALAVLVSALWALVERTRRAGPGVALPVAVLGAAVSVAGEAWHAYTHLQLSTHGGPVAGSVSSVGLVVVVVAVWLAGCEDRRRAAEVIARRRAA